MSRVWQLQYQDVTIWGYYPNNNMENEMETGGYTGHISLFMLVTRKDPALESAVDFEKGADDFSPRL